MDGSNAVQYADAFSTLVDTIFRIVQSPQGVAVLLFLLVLVLGTIVWRLNAQKFRDVSVRLDKCDAEREGCKKREHKNLVAIATLHGVVCSLHQALPEEHPMRRDSDHIRIPTLSELLSGEPSMLAAYNPGAADIAAEK